MNRQSTDKHWRFVCDEQSILWLTLDKDQSAINTLDSDVLAELNSLLDDIISASEIKGLVIQSAKDTGFILGADIKQFTQLNSVDAAAKLIQEGQDVFNKLAGLKIPTVAMINGLCLGGGLELALACRYRVADQASRTRLGLPEILLGLHPGWGGSIRLPKLIGALHALDLILSGRTVDAKTAMRDGLVDAAVPLRQLQRAATYYANGKAKRHRPAFWQYLLTLYPIRMLTGLWLNKKLRKKVRLAHYPAPYIVLNNWVNYGLRLPLAMQEEARSLANLQSHPTARNLIRVFFLQEQLKAQGKGIEPDIQHIHVIGAGVMGGDIAAWCALHGYQVTLQDKDPASLIPALKRAYILFKSKLQQPALKMAMSRLMPDVTGVGIAKADLIIEAIFENLDAKQTLFRSIEHLIKPNAILATNTSSIPLDQINLVLKNPERLVGIHFFNPVSKLKLIEVVRGAKTAPDIIKRVLAWTRKVDRLPLLVTSSPGFLINRILMALLLDALTLFDEGVPKEAIDQALLDFGMPMGALELADKVGLDICLSVSENLTRHYGGKIPRCLQQRVAEKKLGCKTGEGFYRYKKGKLQRDMLVESKYLLQSISDRLIDRLIKEAKACLNENIVENADLLDAGMIFGTGFAPFRGGPLHYADTLAQSE